MRQQDHRKPCVDRGGKRFELPRAQRIETERLRRQTEMGVDAGIAVPWKMLAAGDDFFRLHGLHERQRRRDHGVRCLPEGAFADHRIFGVGVNVEHWGKVQIEAERGEFAAHRAANAGGLLRPSRGIGEARNGRRRPAHPAPLVVDGDQHARASGCRANIGN